MAENGLPSGLTKRGAAYVVQHLVGGKWRRTRVGEDLACALEAHARLRSGGNGDPRPKRKAKERATKRPAPLRPELLGVRCEVSRMDNSREQEGSNADE